MIGDSNNVVMRGKSRHYRDESDPLLVMYAQNLVTSSSVRNPSNPLYASTNIFSSSRGDEGAQPDGDKRLLRASLSVDDQDDDDDKVRNKSAAAATDRRRPSSFPGYRQSQEDDQVWTRRGRVTSPKRKTTGGYRVHRVSYTAQDHIQVLFRLYGSALPNVFPFIVVNVTWCCLVYLLKRYNIMDWTFHSSVGHSFMGLLVSFLIVSRSQISYARFMEYRKLLASSYRACREIAQFSTVYTFYTNTPQAKGWRQEVCYRTILMLQVTMDALLWSSTERNQWEDEYYQYQLQDAVMHGPPMAGASSSTEDDDGDDHDEEIVRPTTSDDSNATDHGESENVSEHFFRFRKLTHGRRSRIDETFRAPITFMHVLRGVIMDHPQYLGYKMAVNEYRDLLDFVSKFDESFHGFRVLVFTPYPFPVSQRGKPVAMCYDH